MPLQSSVRHMVIWQTRWPLEDPSTLVEKLHLPLQILKQPLELAFNAAPLRGSNWVRLKVIALRILCSNTLLIPVRRKPPWRILCQKQQQYPGWFSFSCRWLPWKQWLSRGFCYSTSHGMSNAPLPFVDDHSWSSEHSWSTHMLEELPSRPIKRLAASWLEWRMREPLLQRIIQLREHQLAYLTRIKG